MSFSRVTIASLLIAFVTGLSPTGLAAQQTTERRIVPVEDADYFGHDYQTLKDVTLEACETACLGGGACAAFT